MTEDQIKSGFNMFSKSINDENKVVCKKVGQDFVCDTSNMSIDIDLGFGTFLMLYFVISIASPSK